MSMTQRVDRFQQRHPGAGFPIAVLYKFADDDGHFLAALITYYGFLALFPLLLLLSTALGLLLRGNVQLQQQVIDSALREFPIIGQQLGAPERLGGGIPGLVIGTLVALYGGLGLGQAFQHTMNTAWAVPRHRRPDPITARGRSLLLLGTLGLLVVGSTVLSAMGSGAAAYSGGVSGRGRRGLKRRVQRLVAAPAHRRLRRRQRRCLRPRLQVHDGAPAHCPPGAARGPGRGGHLAAAAILRGHLRLARREAGQRGECGLRPRARAPGVHVPRCDRARALRGDQRRPGGPPASARPAHSLHRRGRPDRRGRAGLHRGGPCPAGQGVPARRRPLRRRRGGSGGTRPPARTMRRAWRHAGSRWRAAPGTPSSRETRPCPTPRSWLAVGRFSPARKDCDVDPRKLRRCAGHRAHRGRRPHRAAVVADAGHRAATGVRADRAVRTGGAEPVRRSRPGLVLEQLPHRRAHRNALRRTQPLGERPGRRGRRVGAGAAADRAGRRPGLLRAGRGEPRLPARGGAHRAVGGGARPPAGGRLAALPHRLGCPVGVAAGVPERRRHRPAHTRALPGMRPVAGREVAGDGAGRGDGRYGRRHRALVRPAVPLPLGPHGQRQVRADPAAEPRPAAAHRSAARGGPAADRVRFGCAVAGARAGRARMSPGQHTVAHAVGGALVRCGVDTVVGVAGSGNFVVTNAMVAAGARYVAARHEGGAATMADAYARMSGTVAALSLHQGCGLTNPLTGITAGAKRRTPLVVVTAEATSPRSNFFVDQAALAEAVGAVPMRVTSAEDAVGTAVVAVTTPREERRVVVLTLPLDVQALAAVAGEPPASPARPAAAPEPGEAERLVDALRRARRPVFVAGRGSRGPGCRAALEDLAGRCGALLATSAVAKGLFRGSPWNLDVSGGFATPLAAELISGADLVVGWGCALNMWTMRHGRLIADDAVVVQVDVERDAIGAQRDVAFGVVGDVRAVAEAATAALPETATGYRTAEVRAAIAARGRWRGEPFADAGGAGHVDPRTLTIALDDLLPAERVVAVDSGNFMGYPSMYLEVPDEHGFCFTQAFQSVGLGLATAIGAALARPDRLPVAALGDGSALMGAAELETVVRLGLPMVVVVYNDAAYGAEVHHFGPDGHPLDTVRFPETDVAAIARGYGFEALTVRGLRDLDAVAAWVAGPRSARCSSTPR